jgi:hypothetical protein
VTWNIWRSDPRPFFGGIDSCPRSPTAHNNEHQFHHSLETNFKTFDSQNSMDDQAVSRLFGKFPVTRDWPPIPAWLVGATKVLGIVKSTARLPLRHRLIVETVAFGQG